MVLFFKKTSCTDPTAHRRVGCAWAIHPLSPTRAGGLPKSNPPYIERARRSNSAIVSVSAWRSPEMSAFANKASPPSSRNEPRSILRRCPNAAAVSFFHRAEQPRIWLRRFGNETHHRGIDFWRRRKRGRGNAHQQRCRAGPLCQYGEAPIGLGVRRRGDALGHFELKHQSQPFPLRGLAQPADQKGCCHVVRQISYDLPRRVAECGKIDRHRIGFQQPQAAVMEPREIADREHRPRIEFHRGHAGGGGI